MAKTKKVNKKEEENLIETSFLNTEDYILEQINNYNNSDTSTRATSPTVSRFLAFNKESGIIEDKTTYSYRNKVYKPIESKLIRDNVVMLPSDATEYGTTEKLVEEIKEFLYSYFEAPKFYKELLPYLILFYWVSDKFPFVPYLHFMGLTGTGKSTAMEIVGSISYKPIDVSGSITIASIFRIASEWRGTLLLDEFTPGGDGYREMLALLKSGVSDRAVLRVEGESKREVMAYLVKSPKMFTSENPITDSGLRSRVMEIKMEKNKGKIPLYRQKRFLVKAEELRNKLLMWRFHNYEKIDLEEMEYGFEELQAFDGRVQQVITPIYYLADDKAKKKILSFAKEQQEETLRERRESLDGLAFGIIYRLYKEGGDPTLTEIADEINKGSKYPITERRIAGQVRKILRFDIQRLGHDNKSTVVSSKEGDRIKDLCEYYGLEFEEYEGLTGTEVDDILNI